MREEKVPLARPALYIIGTPIGNLEDLTLRALRILKEVDLIACEDTRQTQKLLTRYAIPTPTISYHEHNEIARSAELVGQMQLGMSVALVTDAGMPGISDPGYRLISRAIENRLPIVPVPGPSAFLAALVGSGLPADSFCFRGFLPAKPGERRTLLEEVRNSSATVIFYEAPHRIVVALQDVIDILGGTRPVVVARELTKLHEEFLRGSAAEVFETLKQRDAVKGEITLLISKGEKSPSSSQDAQRLNIRERVQQIMSEEGPDEKAALKKAAKERGLSKSEAYRQMQRGQ
jgi:16S rRNA (cytidine1402-2'-O)-methyltransferase